MSTNRQTITYKTVGKLEISFDIYLPDNAKNVPILLWFHGGGLLMGHRGTLAGHLRRSANKYGHAVVSADYRLAPQVGIAEIYEDVRDCIAFIRAPNGLSKQLDAGLVDPSRLAVSGSSAGGYLAFLAGLYTDPKPNVLLPIYPITDPLGVFFTNSQPAPTLKDGIVDASKKVSEALVAPFVDRNAEVVANNESGSDRVNMYAYMMDRANLADLLHLNVSDKPYHDPENEKWRVAKQVKACGLPPTCIVHGDLDRAVGIEQADEVVGVMVGGAMEVRYERLTGKDHLFDQLDEKVELEGLYEYMHQHLGSGEGEAMRSGGRL